MLYNSKPKSKIKAAIWFYKNLSSDGNLIDKNKAVHNTMLFSRYFDFSQFGIVSKWEKKNAIFDLETHW